MVGGGGDEGQGARSPRCCSCCVRTPRTRSDSPTLVRTPPCSFVLPRTRLYPPALVCTPLCSFVPSCTPSYPPTHPLYLLALVCSRCCHWCWCSRACSHLVCAGTRYPVAFVWPLFAFVCAHSYSFGLIYLYQMQS